MKTTTEAEIFPLADAKLAVEIAALRDPLAQLSNRVYSYPGCAAVRARLEEAVHSLNEAIREALTVNKGV